MPNAVELRCPNTSPSTAANGLGRDAKGVRALTQSQHSTGRRSTGKRLRFEVFKRDYFTCRYCGAQPPDAVLVVDHIVAIADGGSTTLENLITACEPCNQGKSDRSLGDVQPRVDADLLYMETQQEIAEIRRYQRTIVAKEAALASLAEDLIDRFAATTNNGAYPSERHVLALLGKYELDVVGESLDNVAQKVAGGYLGRSRGEWMPYLWSVARNKSREGGG